MTHQDPHSPSPPCADISQGACITRVWDLEVFTDNLQVFRAVLKWAPKPAISRRNSDTKWVGQLSSGLLVFSGFNLSLFQILSRAILPMKNVMAKLGRVTLCYIYYKTRASENFYSKIPCKSQPFLLHAISLFCSDSTSVPRPLAFSLEWINSSFFLWKAKFCFAQNCCVTIFCFLS